MNYEIKETAVIDGFLWRCSFMVWEKGKCRCGAKTVSVDIHSETRPTLEDMKKAALN